MERRVISTKMQEEDIKIESSLRPQTLADYIGQEKIKDNLAVYIEAARQRQEALDHVLFFGPPGLGKTTLAGIIANEMGTHLKITSGPAIAKPGEMAAILNGLSEGDILFIDEIHRLNRQVEEVLYSAMEDFYIDVVIGKESGAAARTIRLDLPPFTLVGATTRAGDLTAPLRDRFGIVSKLEYYTENQLMDIVSRSSKVFNVVAEKDAVREIAIRSRGTPRIANRLLRRVRDFAQVYNDGHLDLNVTNHALDALKVDGLGLDEVDLRYLRGIIERFKGGPVGLESLASAISEEATTLEDVYEPYLIQIGFVNRTPRGRVATPKAYEHLKINFNGTLFEGEF